MDFRPEGTALLTFSSRGYCLPYIAVQGVLLSCLFAIPKVSQLFYLCFLPPSFSAFSAVLILRTCWTGTFYSLRRFQHTILALNSLLLLQLSRRFFRPAFFGAPVCAATILATTYLFLLASQYVRHSTLPSFFSTFVISEERSRHLPVCAITGDHSK